MIYNKREPLSNEFKGHLFITLLEEKLDTFSRNLKNKIQELMQCSLKPLFTENKFRGCVQ